MLREDESVHHLNRRGEGGEREMELEMENEEEIGEKIEIRK